MVVIPRNQSQKAISGVSVGRKNATLASSGGRDIALIGEALSNTALAFQRARGLEERSKANIDVSRQINDIKVEAAQDPDVWSEDKYQAKLAEVRTNSGGNITTPASKARFQRDLEPTLVAADFNIRKGLRTRQVDSMKATMFEEIDTLETEIIGTASLPKEQQKAQQKFIKEKRDKLFEENIKAGVIDRIEGYNHKEKTDKAWDEAVIRESIAIDPKEMLLSWQFENQTADETAKWVEVVDKKIEYNKKKDEVARDEKWLNNQGEILENLRETSVEDIARSIAHEDIDPDIGRKWIEWKTNPKYVQYETDKKVWTEIVRDSVNPELDLREFQRTLAKAVSNGDIQIVDASNLSEQIRGFYETAIAFKTSDNPIKRAIRSGMDYIKEYALKVSGRSNAVDVTYALTRDFVSKATQGNLDAKETKELARDIVKGEVASQHPETVGLDDVPNAIGSQKDGIKSVFEGSTNLKASSKINNQDSVKEFDNIAEAENANLPIGTMITIKGRLARIE